MISKLVQGFFKLNIRSIIFNFRILPFCQAIRIPIIISRYTKIQNVSRGSLTINTFSINPGMIKIGWNYVDIIDCRYERTIINVRKGGKIEFHGKAYIGAGSKISVGPLGKLVFGDEFKISARSTIICQNNMLFGRHCLLSWDVLVMDTDFHKILSDKYDNPLAASSMVVAGGGMGWGTRYITNPDKPIIFGNNIWIGCRVTILKGSILLDGAVVGAGSIISNMQLHEKSIYAGNPLCLIKKNIEWQE